MATAKPEPIVIDDEQATEAESDDRAAIEEVRAVVDAERGYPRRCKCRDGSEPAPGVPCVVEHAFDIEPVEVDDDGKPTRWATKLPEQAEVPAEVLAKVTARKPSEIRDLKAAMADNLAGGPNR